MIIIELIKIWIDVIKQDWKAIWQAGGVCRCCCND